MALILVPMAWLLRGERVSGAGATGKEPAT